MPSNGFGFWRLCKRFPKFCRSSFYGVSFKIIFARYLLPEFLHFVPCILFSLSLIIFIRLYSGYIRSFLLWALKSRNMRVYTQWRIKFFCNANEMSKQRSIDKSESLPNGKCLARAVCVNVQDFRLPFLFRTKIMFQMCEYEIKRTLSINWSLIIDIPFETFFSSMHLHSGFWIPFRTAHITHRIRCFFILSLCPYDIAFSHWVMYNV